MATRLVTHGNRGCQLTSAVAYRALVFEVHWISNTSVPAGCTQSCLRFADARSSSSDLEPGAANDAQHH